MSEIEVPLEQLTEDMHHAIHNAHGNSSESSFLNRAAILSALLAVTAAIAALFAGHYSNDAMIEQIQSSDQWALYQAKGIKRAISDLKQTTTESAEDAAKTEKYKKDQEEIKEKAEEIEHESQMHLVKHQSLAASVTFFQVAIALTAIAVLARKRKFLWGSCTLGVLGFIFMIKGLFF